MKNEKIWEKMETPYGTFYHRKPAPFENEILIRDGCGTRQTQRRIKLARELGYDIIDGNDYKLPDRKKWEEHYVIALRKTNSRTRGFCVATTFAVKPVFCNSK